jgi:XTP/dITP diphosphohydrolase
MLGELKGKTRTCRFRTVALLRFPDGREVIAEGVCEGSIAEAEIGERGFGYDPLFIARDGDGRTFAQMTVDEKHALSHRGKAFRALSEMLKNDSPTA